MRCGTCGTENRDAARFCTECGARLASTCTGCTEFVVHELHAVCEPDASNAFWAAPTRIADLDTLTAPEVRAVIDRRGIDLVDVGSC